MAAYAAAAAAAWCRRALENLPVGPVGIRIYCSRGSIRKCEGNVLDSAHRSDANIMRDKIKIGEEAQRHKTEKTTRRLDDDTRALLEEYRQVLKANGEKLDKLDTINQVGAFIFAFAMMIKVGVFTDTSPRGIIVPEVGQIPPTSEDVPSNK